MASSASYVDLLESGELSRRVSAAYEILSACTLCPRDCGVDRTSGAVGLCGVGELPMVSSYGPHFGEEPPLVGANGSGTIFMTGCNLQCIYCQNYDISQLRRGEIVSVGELAQMMLSLQARGCHNINLVTPTHQVPQILADLEIAAKQRLHLPLVYNCGGYESLDTLRLLDGIIDIYMPDMKYSDNQVGLELSGVKNYWDHNRAAVEEMHRQVGVLQIAKDEDTGASIATRGLLVRHLVLPEGLSGTAEIVRFLAEEISRDTYINIMDQYRPCYRAVEHPVIGRRLSREEFNEAMALARAAGLWRFAH